MYTPENITDIDAFRNALRSGSTAEVIAAVLNHVEYMLSHRHDLTTERIVTPTELEKELALAYERAHKAETKIIELQMQLDKLNQKPKPKPVVDNRVMFVFGNHTTSFFDSPTKCRSYVRALRDTLPIRTVEMVCYRDACRHIPYGASDDLKTFINLVETFLDKFQGNSL